MRSFGRFFGIPDDLLPPDREAFSSYLDDMLGGELLGASGASRSLARQVLWFEHRVVPSPIVRVERVLALATLDPRVVDRLGIRPDTADVALGRRVDAWLSLHYRRFPRPPRVLPGLYVLMRRPSVGLAGRRSDHAEPGAGDGRRLKGTVRARARHVDAVVPCLTEPCEWTHVHLTTLHGCHHCYKR